MRRPGNRGVRIAVASGKGGTGKTTVSLGLAAMFGEALQLADCDVEEPNINLFLGCHLTETDSVISMVPEVSSELCTGCGKCSEICNFRGIVSIGTKALVFPELCHGCGGCTLVCPNHAITEKEHRTGTVASAQFEHIKVLEGRLEVGASMVPEVIRTVINRLQEHIPAILDAPPGTSCSVMATLRDCDYVLLVTEPTPFGLHDLKLAVEMVRELGLPCGVVVNRNREDLVGLARYCREEGLPVLLSIPDDRQIAELSSRGRLLARSIPEYGRMFADLAARLRRELLNNGGPQ